MFTAVTGYGHYGAFGCQLLPHFQSLILNITIAYIKLISNWRPVMYMDAHNIDSKGENTENSTLRLTKSNTSQKIASQLHI